MSNNYESCFHISTFSMSQIMCLGKQSKASYSGKGGSDFLRTIFIVSLQL